MIPTSAKFKLMAATAAVMAHGVLAYALYAPEGVLIEDQAGTPGEVRLGSSFEDLAVGTLDAPDIVDEATQPTAQAAPTPPEPDDAVKAPLPDALQPPDAVSSEPPSLEPVSLEPVTAERAPAPKVPEVQEPQEPVKTVARVQPDPAVAQPAPSSPQTPIAVPTPEVVAALPVPTPTPLPLPDAQEPVPLAVPARPPVEAPNPSAHAQPETPPRTAAESPEVAPAPTPPKLAQPEVQEANPVSTPAPDAVTEPAAQPPSVSETPETPTDTLTALPESSAPVASRRPPPARSKSFEEKHAPKVAHTQPKAPAPSQTSRGNTQRSNATAGSATGSTTARATQSGRTSSGTQSGNTAAASNYPGKVFSCVGRAARRVSGRGAATIAFSVSGSGRITGAYVAQSSGNARLDRALVRAIAGTRCPAPPAGARRSYSVRAQGR